MEDYYGFVNVPAQQLKLEHHSRIKPKLQQNIRSANTGQLVRSLKRTELSKERLRSKESKKQRRVVLPKPVQLIQQKELQSGMKVVPSENKSLSNQQEIELMVKKYSSYNNVDSYEFRGNETSRVEKSNCLPDDQGRIRFRREAKISVKDAESVNKQPKTPEGKIRAYCSLSQEKRHDFLSLFKRESLNQRNLIDRFAERVVMPGLLRRSKTTSVVPKALHRMHTYYNVQKREYYNYNDSGYRTAKQFQLLNRMERRSLDAFQRAFPQRRTKVNEKTEKRFEVQENEEMLHRNSGILSNFPENGEGIQHTNTVASKSLEHLQRQLTEQKYDSSANILIDSRKSSRLGDDYQMGTSFKKLIERPSVGELFERKDIFQHFARASEDSLLEFKPEKAKEEKKVPEEPLKLSCSILERVGAVEMTEMEINSNCKPSEQVLQTVPDVIKGKESNGRGLMKRMSSQNDRNSNMQQSNSRSSSYQSSYSHYSDFFSKTISLQSKRHSNEATSPKDTSANKLDFSKKNVKKQSESLSEGLSDSGQRDLKNTAQFNSISRQGESQSRGVDLLVESYKFQSAEQIKSVISNKIEGDAEAVKIRIKKMSQRSEKSSSGRSEVAMDGLAMQSFPYYGSREVLGIPLKPINEKESKFQNEIESYNESSCNESAFKAKRQGSSFTAKDKITSSTQQMEQVVGCQQVRKVQSLTEQYHLFHQLQLLTEYQQNEQGKAALTEQMLGLLPAELRGVLEKIEAHLHAIGWMRQIVHLIPEVYELQSIYSSQNEWVLLSLFLTLKKWLYEKERVVTALGGGRNCFNSLCIIEEGVLNKYLGRAEVLGIGRQVRECNVWLQQLIGRFYCFLIQLNSSYREHAVINTMVFNNDEQLFVLLCYFDQEIDVLLYQREQLRSVSEGEELVVVKMHERVFRLMEVGFMMSNLSGRPIKSVEYDDCSLYSGEKQFQNYLFQNHQQFKEVVKYFK